jgi:DNA polymerase-3 subunit delta
MLYLFYGPDEFARSEAVAALRATLPPDLAALNSTTLEGRKLKLDALASACEALPFLAEKRLVIVNDALKHAKAGKDRDELRAYLERVPPTCDLLFVEHDDIDKRNALFTHLKKIAQVQEFQPRSGNELLRWLNERAQGLKVRLDKAAAQHLVDFVGNDGRALATELDKLASYVGRGGQITSAVVDLLVQDAQEQNLFAFIDALSMRQRGAALHGVRALLAEGQAATYIMFMLARQVRILLGVQQLAAQRMRADDIAAQLKQKPFVVRKALGQARNFRADELEALHDRLVEMDHAIKTGRIQADVALEVLVIEMCGETGPRSERMPG